jgi:hypothetical protein
MPQAFFLVLACTLRVRQRLTPELDFEGSDGGNQFQLVLAVELFAVAPKMSKRRVSIAI